MTESSKLQVQYGAIPYRRRADGTIDVLLVTSRETRRWIIPKGWPIPGLTAHEAAAREAFEEAGLVGRIVDQPVGSYRYAKRRADGSSVDCLVEVFPFEVHQQIESWPEQDERQTRWFSCDAAADAVQESELSDLIRAIASALR